MKSFFVYFKNKFKFLAENTGRLMFFFPGFLKRRIATLPYYKIKNKQINLFFFYFFKQSLQNSKRPIKTLRKFDNYVLSLDLRSYVNRRSFYLNGEGINEDLQVLINSLLTKDDVYVDIGANIGHTTLMAARKVKKVIAFEPVEKMLTHFKRNMVANNIKNVVLYDFALSDKKGKALIKISTSNDGSHTLNSNFANAIAGTYEKEIEIRTEKFDNLKINKATMVKIDVEGHELEVLKGMSKSINKVSYVVCETNGENYFSLQKFFKKNGFEQIEEYFDKNTGMRNLYEKIGLCNLLFVNKRKVKDIGKIRRLCKNLP